MAGNVYMSITFSSVPKDLADQIRAAAEQLAGNVDFSVDYGDPIGDAVSEPTPIAEEAAEAVAAPTDQTPADDLPEAPPAS